MKGKFRPKNPRKYKGDVESIYYRSSWELRVMVNLDADRDVIQWSSEEIRIPYRSKIDGSPHTYYPDFWVKNRDGEYILEVKPFHQTIPPQPSRKRTKQYISEVMTYGTNLSKWEAAERYCKTKGWTFQILSEKELGIK